MTNGLLDCLLAVRCSGMCKFFERKGFGVFTGGRVSKEAQHNAQHGRMQFLWCGQH